MAKHTVRLSIRVSVDSGHSGLWNVRHVDKIHDPRFLDVLDNLIRTLQ